MSRRTLAPPAPRRPLAAPTLVAVLATAALLACAGGRPTIVTSSPATVNVELEPDGDVFDATELAQQECEKHALVASFERVDTTASPDARIARFACVDPNAPAPLEEDWAQDEK